MGTVQDSPRSVDVDLIRKLGEALSLEAFPLRDEGVEALLAYRDWLNDFTGADQPVSMALAPVEWEGRLETQFGQGLDPDSIRRDLALSHAVTLVQAGQLDGDGTLGRAREFLAFLEASETTVGVMPPDLVLLAAGWVPRPETLTDANFPDRLGELEALGLFLWGSECVGECDGNTTPDSLVCDTCNGTRTTPLFSLSRTGRQG